MISFLINRSRKFVGLCAKLISLFGNYKIENNQLLKKWTADIINDDLMMTLEGWPRVKKFVK